MPLKACLSNLVIYSPYIWWNINLFLSKRQSNKTQKEWRTGPLCREKKSSKIEIKWKSKQHGKFNKRHHHGGMKDCPVLLGQRALGGWTRPCQKGMGRTHIQQLLGVSMGFLWSLDQLCALSIHFSMSVGMVAHLFLSITSQAISWYSMGSQGFSSHNPWTDEAVILQGDGRAHSPISCGNAIIWPHR